MSHDLSSASPFEELRSETGQEWLAIADARAEALAKRRKIEAACANLSLSPDLALVAYGSLARQEWTSGSDVDWTLLVDGPADADHLTDAQRIRDALKEFNPPGQSLTFGTLCSSFDLIHHIGGLEDTNQNLTRRVLLLLESVSINDSVAHERVLRGILKRYIATDPAVSTTAESARAPLFLLNDIVRLWRTIAVDYATKKWRQGNQKWAIRNIKLRMSRKLLFVKGLLLCFSCESDLSMTDFDPKFALDHIVKHCLEFSRRPAIEVLCDAILKSSNTSLAVDILGPYDQFLRILNAPEQREQLVKLDFESADSDKLFQKLRTASHTYREGLNKLFFDDPRLAPLTRKLGVF